MAGPTIQQKPYQVKRLNRRIYFVLGGICVVVLVAAIWGWHNRQARIAAPGESQDDGLTLTEMLARPDLSDYPQGLLVSMPEPTVSANAPATEFSASQDTPPPPPPKPDPIEQKILEIRLEKMLATLEAPTGLSKSDLIPGGGQQSGTMQQQASAISTNPTAVGQIASAEGSGGYGPLASRRQAPASPYVLRSGWVIPCQLTAAGTNVQPGDLTCMVERDIRDSATGECILIPKGSTAIGPYDTELNFGQDKILVIWREITFPDASSLALAPGMAGVDALGAAGLPGDVNNHYLKLLAGVAMASVLRIGYDLSTDTSGDRDDTENVISNAVGQEVNRVGSRLIDRFLNIKPTISTEIGQANNILVTQDIVFDQPWNCD